jgi:aspartate/methionine/tyrosine aminotransferase
VSCGKLRPRKSDVSAAGATTAVSASVSPAGSTECSMPARAPDAGRWRTHPEELAAAIGPRTAAILLMGPAMPTGAVLDSSHLELLAEPVRRRRVGDLRRRDGTHPL